MSRADACTLAYTLAIGVLGLYDTPWIKQGWMRSNITVIAHEGKLIAQHPFLTRGLQARVLTTTSDEQSTSFGIVRNQTLFTLGLLLIELCMRKSIESLHTDADFSKDGEINELSCLRTAQRLLRNNDISDESGKRFSDVVSRCIFCDFNNASASLDDVDFQKAVYANVVQELEVNYLQFFKL